MKSETKKKKNIKKYTRKKFNKLKCAPLQKNIVDYKLKEISCYTNTTIFYIRDKFNKENPKNKIISNDPLKIWKALKKNNKDCTNEKCWLTKNDINDINILDIFRPKSPKIWKKNPYAWLSSNDIIKVMNQYEKKYKNFKFIGPSPIDFQDKKLYGNCVWEELCNFSIKNQINNKKYKIGIILNLDPHYKAGSHWVALFIDIKKEFILYFDSNGIRPNKRVQNFINKILDESNKHKIKINYFNNANIEHQKQDGQCGMYCLYIIIKLLREDINPNDIKNYRITDQEMKDYRNIYFNL